jgi:hypothetical protein
MALNGGTQRQQPVYSGIVVNNFNFNCMMQGWLNNTHCKWAKAIDFSEGLGLACLFGTYHVGGSFYVVSRMLIGYVLVPTTLAPRAALVGNWACKLVGMHTW